MLKKGGLIGQISCSMLCNVGAQYNNVHTITTSEDVDDDGVY